jgi:hypothetical protein
MAIGTFTVMARLDQIETKARMLAEADGYVWDGRLGAYATPLSEYSIKRLYRETARAILDTGPDTTP